MAAHKLTEIAPDLANKAAVSVKEVQNKLSALILEARQCTRNNPEHRLQVLPVGIDATHKTVTDFYKKWDKFLKFAPSEAIEEFLEWVKNDDAKHSTDVRGSLASVTSPGILVEMATRIASNEDIKAGAQFIAFLDYLEGKGRIKIEIDPSTGKPRKIDELAVSVLVAMNDVINDENTLKSIITKAADIVYDPNKMTDSNQIINIVALRSNFIGYYCGAFKIAREKAADNKKTAALSPKPISNTTQAAAPSSVSLPTSASTPTSAPTSQPTIDVQPYRTALEDLEGKGDINKQVDNLFTHNNYRPLNILLTEIPQIKDRLKSKKEEKKPTVQEEKDKGTITSSKPTVLGCDAAHKTDKSKGTTTTPTPSSKPTETPGDDKDGGKGTKPTQSSWSFTLLKLMTYVARAALVLAGTALAFTGMCALLTRYQSSAVNMVSGTKMEPLIVNLTASASKIVSQLPERVQQVVVSRA